ncbi:MAG: hypothetical protein K2Y01_09955 [Rhabdochlamydiaceae bacterium]|nr:hypothetical protein [Rhabdochlamydiaceae bacterium]
MKFFLLSCYSACLLAFASPLFSESRASSKAKVFSLTSEEMVFASKLSDVNRRRFCYQFSIKERTLAMQTIDSDLTADARVEEVFSSLSSSLEPKAYTR